VTEPSGADARSADHRTHNELSGSAQTAAMARIVYGGIHVHHSRRWKPPKARPSDRLVVSSVMIVATVASIVVQVTIRAQDDDQVASRLGNGPTEVVLATPPAAEFDQGRRDLTTSQFFELDIPPRLNAALPQSHRCRDMTGPRADTFSRKVKKNFDMRSVARDYADSFVDSYWGLDSTSRFSWGPGVERSAVGSGRIYRGVTLSVDVGSMTRDPRVGSDGHLKVLILDGSEFYLLLLLMADLSGDSRKAELPTKQDLDHVVDTARPRS
jgi:hypothetical protein